jgi:TIR domain
VKAFISYAHNDHAAYEKMRVYLKPIERAYKVEIWADKRIKTGDYWTDKIEQAIKDACIHILMVSPEFIDSDYIFNHELPAINARYQNGALVLPVIVKRCCWEPFMGPLQAAPSSPHGRLLPIAEWKPKDNGFEAVREQLSTAIESHFDVKPNGYLDWKRA